MSDTTDRWAQIARRELKDRPLESISTETPEGITVKPLYTADDCPPSAAEAIPGVAPFARGIRGTMYTGRPWTIRQYAGFSTAEESNAFYRKNLAGGQKGLSVALTWPRIVVMTVIMSGSLAMLARPGWPSIPLKT